ncbi:MAG: hypothetical protein IJC09_02085 [Clostridia bacterium]|nr:hypothetical protein [Clostridia bacterium]
MLKHTILFGLGGVMYLIIELLWRGSSHWSMFILGGACFLVVGLINEKNRGRIPLLLQMLISAVIITGLEFVTGYIVNIRMGLDVWDYYDMPYNIMGQVCLLYTVLWFFLSLACIIADDWLRHVLFGEEKQKYRII